MLIETTSETTLGNSLATAWTLSTIRTVAVLAVVLAVCAGEARALDELPNEKAKLRACEKNFCTMVLLKENKGDDLSCKLTKTWGKRDIKKGGESKVSWGFGDARCTTDVKMGRKHIIAALTLPKYTVVLNRQEVNCIVERSDGEHKVRAILSPKIKFKKGQADKVWINLKELDGPGDIKGTVWATAHLEDTLGIFHRAIIKGINKFLYRKCSKRYAKELGLGGAASSSAKAKPSAPAGKSASAKDRKSND